MNIRSSKMYVTPAVFVLFWSCMLVRSLVTVTRQFSTRDECLGNYGGPPGESITSFSRANCASKCSMDASCQSFVYSVTTTYCWLFPHRKYDPKTPGCTLDVVYGENLTDCVYNPTNEYRLCDGSADRGRVEVIHLGVWGTVCDDIQHQESWDDQNAKVVCRQFGFTNGTSILAAGFGQGQGRIILDDVDCSGTELSLFECPRNELFDHDCTHWEDVGVICF